MGEHESLRKVEVVPADEVEVLTGKEAIIRRWLFESPPLTRRSSGLLEGMMAYFNETYPEREGVQLSVALGKLEPAKEDEDELL